MNQPKKSGNPFVNNQLLKQCKTMAIIALGLGLLAIGLGLSVHQSLKQLKTGHPTLLAENEAFTKQMETQQKQFEQLEAQVAERFNHMRPGLEHQLLSQIIYLVHLADLQLELSHNPNAAIHLLKTAQKRLQELHDPALLPLHRALTKDISTLARFSDYSPAQTALALNEVYRKLEQLPFRRMSMPHPEHKLDKKSAAYQELPWYQKAWSNLGGLKRFMIIHHDTKGYTPLLSIQQKALLRDDIRAKLLQTEWATLHREPKLYEENIGQVVQWIKHYFQPTHKRRQLLKTLVALRKINVAPELPSIEKSLMASHKILSVSWHALLTSGSNKK